MEKEFFDETLEGAPYASSSEYWDDLLKLADLLLIELLRREPGQSARRPAGLPVETATIPEALAERCLPEGMTFSPELAEQVALAREHISERMAVTAAPETLTLDYIADAFRISNFKYVALLLSLAPRFDRKYEGIYGALSGVRELPGPTFGLVLAACECAGIPCAGEARAFFGGDRVYGMLFRRPEEGFAAAGLGCVLEAHPDIARTAMGGFSISGELASRCSYFRAGEPLSVPCVNAEIVSRLSEELSGINEEGAASHRAIVLRGAKGSGRRFAARHATAALGLDLLEMDMAGLPEDGAGREALLLSLEREYILHPSLICLCSCGENGVSEADEAAFIDRVSGFAPFFWITAGPDGARSTKLCSVPVSEVLIPTPGYGETARLLERFTADIPLEPGTDLTDIAASHRLTPGAVLKSLELAKLSALRDGQYNVSTKNILEGLDECSTQAMSGLGEFVPTFYTAADLITTKSNRELMELAVAHMKYRGTVREKWGMDSRNAYGRGVCMLFYGPPGTGKTMAAQVMAHEAGMRLFRVDSSQLTSKYIGETSKNISRLFDEAKGGDYVLFFDEADSIFGKRTNASDANDRYANSDTSFLLQKIEEYDGMVVLATNLLNNIDEAFRRRITYMVNFTLPDRELRESIWRSMFPETMPRGELDFPYLSGFDLSGSGIKSIVISAAYLSAMESAEVGMSQIVRALQIYFGKTGKRLLRKDLSPYEEFFEL